ncbi:Retrovirus-related Pol polyprotein from transposon RE2 [Vitis vinifera]|uniref:Retrovirus-related Pol polyprotein from transposon RE2 n=1 Tax=Vitis vinifera TaxID=29760 RepID=A0A438ENM6_VITVI|nr:Retrovirus-related Pol polyprotein from transposon RE2 [Vitis vinifera]
MFITMDVVFHEDSMYFSFESELQGEYHKEIQTLDYDYHISEEDESGQSELVNQEAGELDMSGQQFGSEDVFTEIPNQSSSAEGVLNLEPDLFMKRLPHRHNRGIPKPTYEPELSTKVKYPMSYYVSNHRLSESNKSFVNQLSTVTISNSVQEALADPRWKAAMNEEMKSLQKNETRELTFAPVAKINTVRVLLFLAANLDWLLQQFDVKNVFLHNELSEEVYMGSSTRMHGVRKAMLEGVQIEEVIIWVKAIPRAWFGRFTKSMRDFGYRQSNSNHTLFLKKQHGKITTLIVYVDDMETGMSGCQPVNTPIDEGLKLCVEPNQVSTDKGRYQRLVGRLMYLAHTRPDLAYALSAVSQHMHNPGDQHMNVVMRILGYLKNAPGKGILFAKIVDHQSIEVYTDADWAGAVDDRRSTSGYFTFVGGNLVTWKDLGYLSRQPIRLFCDNKAACDIAHNPVQHDRIKHVEVDRFFIKEKLDDKIVELPKIRSEDQLADILTKAVSSQVFSKFLDKLGMCDIYAPT